MLGHMKSIKMSGLGQKLGISIARLRKDEIDAAAPFRLMSALLSAIAQVPVLLSPVAAFAFFTIPSRESGLSLDTTRMFTSLSLIMLLGQPLFWMLEALLNGSAALGCFKRIQTFLSKPPRAHGRVLISQSSEPAKGVGAGDEPNAQLHSPPQIVELSRVGHTMKKIGVTFRSSAFSWSENGPAVLNHLDVDIPNGQLVMVVGAVASGKSTLMKGLLGELPSTECHVEQEHRRAAFCEQTPWLFVSIRNVRLLQADCPRMIPFSRTLLVMPTMMRSYTAQSSSPAVLRRTLLAWKAETKLW
jgi:ATP-binding cassette, subfamily C (CFTR/MRP), member 1